MKKRWNISCTSYPKFFTYRQAVKCFVTIEVFLFIFSMVILVVPSHKANAAHLSIVESGICNIRLFGIIEEDDLAELMRLSSQFPENERLILCLNSAGGSFMSGVKLASFIHENGIGTYVERGAICESICSIVFFMGTSIEENEKSINRGASQGAQVGLGPPMLSVDANGSYTANQVMQAFELALEATAQITNLAKNIDNQTGRYWIPISALNMMLNAPPDDIYYIDSAEDFQRWGIYITDYAGERK